MNYSDGDFGEYNKTRKLASGVVTYSRKSRFLDELKTSCDNNFNCRNRICGYYIA